MSRSKSTQLQLFAFDMNASWLETQAVYQLDIPAAWKEWICQLRKGGLEADYALDKRTKPLGDKLQALFPDLVVINNQFYKAGDDRPWLIAVRPIAPDIILLLVKAWFLKL